MIVIISVECILETGTIGQWEMGDPGGGSRAPGRRGGWRRQPAMARRPPGVGPASAGGENMTKKKIGQLIAIFLFCLGIILELEFEV